MSENNYSDESRSTEKENGRGSWVAWLVVGVLFLPAIVIGFCVYGILRWGKHRLSIVSIVSFLGLLTSIIVWFATSAGSRISDFQYDGFSSLIPALASIYIALGSVGGLVAAGLALRSMKSSPHRLALAGDWMYNFQFKKTPWEKARKKKLKEKLEAGGMGERERAPLGISEEDDSIVYRYESEVALQTLVSGAAGSGKTVTMMSLMLNDIRHGIPVVMVDFKRDPKLAAFLATQAKKHGGTFRHFTNGNKTDYDIPNSEGQSTYSPIPEHSPEAAADMLLNMREYDTASSVYKGNMRDLLISLTNLIEYADPALAPDIDWNHGMISMLSSIINGNVSSLAAACEGKGKEVEAIAKRLVESTKGRNGSLSHALEELRGQLSTMTTSGYGRWLKNNDEDSHIDLYEATLEKGSVTLFSMNADVEKDFSTYMGSLIMADLSNTSARRRNAGLEKNAPLHVYVDEFQAVPPSSITGLLEKSRASQMGMTIASQSFDQIKTSAGNNGDSYLASIMDTCSNFIIHKGSTEDSAQRLSKIIGRHMVTVYRQASKRESGLLSFNIFNRRHQNVQTSQEEQPIKPSSYFMRLEAPTSSNGYKATAVYINKSIGDESWLENHASDETSARKVWLITENEVREDFYTKEARADARKYMASKVRNTPQTASDALLTASEGREALSARVPDLSLSESPTAPYLAVPHSGNDYSNVYDAGDDDTQDDGPEWGWGDEMPDPGGIEVPQHVLEEQEYERELNEQKARQQTATRPATPSAPRVESPQPPRSPEPKAIPKPPTRPTGSSTFDEMFDSSYQPERREIVRPQSRAKKQDHDEAKMPDVAAEASGSVEESLPTLPPLPAMGKKTNDDDVRLPDIF